MPLISRLLRRIAILSLFLSGTGLAVASHALAAPAASAIPPWLVAHVGDGDGQISWVVLRRARDLYLRKVSAGLVKNSCYFAMDATRPNDLGGGHLGRRFYTICEGSRTFRAIPAGHGSGKDLKGVADFSNGRVCAKNFGNAMDSNLTAGGIYMTGETKKSFKGYYRISATRNVPFSRSFVQFDGEGETANARARAIGGHAAMVLRAACMLKDPASPHANNKGLVPLGKLINYAGGRSDGCTSWEPSDASQIIAMVQDDPTTLYIYPDAADIHAVDMAVAAGRSLSSAGLYWNTTCLKAIHAPKFWSKSLEPVIAEYRRNHPPPHYKPMPICGSN